MAEQWVALNSLPSGGLNLTVDDPAVWAEPLREFGLALTVRIPLKADMFLLPQEGGCFVRGHLTGEVSLPCDRCTEEAVLTIDQSFETFEPFPVSDAARHDDEDDFADIDGEIDETVMRLGESGPEINPAVLAWEEFSLALPTHPICRSDCAGLCMECGQNLNEASCACARDEGDPRLAALRGFKVQS